MLVAVLRQCDVRLEGAVRALFPGQTYDLPEGQAKSLIEAGLAETREHKDSASTAEKPRKTK